LAKNVVGGRGEVAGTSRPALRTLAVVLFALAVLVAPAAAQTNGIIDEDFETYAVDDTSPGPCSITQSGSTTSQITDTATAGYNVAVFAKAIL
jgi:hypothetical protein